MKTKLRQPPPTVNHHTRPAPSPVSLELAIAELTIAFRRQAEELFQVRVMLDAMATPPPAPRQQLLTAKQICESLQISRGHLHTLRGQGMPVLSLGSESPRYDLDEVIAWIKSRGAK